jgi:hypothetical protein
VLRDSEEKACAITGRKLDAGARIHVGRWK